MFLAASAVKSQLRFAINRHENCMWHSQQIDSLTDESYHRSVKTVPAFDSLRRKVRKKGWGEGKVGEWMMEEKRSG